MHQQFINGKKFFGFFLAAILVSAGRFAALVGQGRRDPHQGRPRSSKATSPKPIVPTSWSSPSTACRPPWPATTSTASNIPNPSSRIIKTACPDHPGRRQWTSRFGTLAAGQKGLWLAFQEVIAAQKIDPNNRDAGTLYNTIVLQQRLATPVHPAPANPSPTAGGHPSATPGTTNPSAAAHQVSFRRRDQRPAPRRVEGERQ